MLILVRVFFCATIGQILIEWSAAASLQQKSLPPFASYPLITLIITCRHKTAQNCCTWGVRIAKYAPVVCDRSSRPQTLCIYCCLHEAHSHRKGRHFAPNDSFQYKSGAVLPLPEPTLHVYVLTVHTAFLALEPNNRFVDLAAGKCCAENYWALFLIWFDCGDLMMSPRAVMLLSGTRNHHQLFHHIWL